MGELIQAAQVSLLDIIQRASAMPDLDLDRITRLYELKERFDAMQAKLSFARDMVEFKKHAPVIYKNKRVSYGHGKTGFDHATHDEVTTKLAPALANHGFSHSWQMTQSAGVVTVTCTLLHVDGHTTSATLFGVDDTTGSKSANQAVASTGTLLQRHTLLSVTGCSTSDMPDEDDLHKVNKTLVSDEVFAKLKAAAEGGNDSMRVAWQATDPAVRAAITGDYPDIWLQLKQACAAAQAKLSTGA